MGSSSVPQWLQKTLVDEMPNLCGVWWRRSLHRIHFMRLHLSCDPSDNLTVVLVGSRTIVAPTPPVPGGLPAKHDARAAVCPRLASSAKIFGTKGAMDHAGIPLLTQRG